ncbi:MAG: sel1 repeat family protein [Rhodospirillaceae bacterium]|nr:sel1 repeat family protein [Rhodospirillaceae bacterium]
MSDDSVIVDAPALAPTVPQSTAPIALSAGDETGAIPATGDAAPPPAPVQQAAVTPVAPSTRTDGNWLIGQWQGPSLGCPQGGGVEFTDNETLSWFDGQIAVRLASTYAISGDNIVVTATGGDGTPLEYTYQRSGPDKIIIVSIPPSMPKSLLGIAYRRCGPAPALTATLPAAQTPVVLPTAASPSPVPATAPLIDATPVTPAAATSPASTSAASAAPAPAIVNGTAAAGWKAFENGQYEEALAIFKSLGEAGDTNMQVIVGNIYDYGQGVPQDDVQAMQWYLMAAERGNTKGQYQAGVLYYRSQGVPQDLIESYRWLALAAEGPSPGMASDPAHATGIQARNLLGEVAAGMSSADIAKAKALVKKTRKKS